MLALGDGLLASGPRPVIEELQRVAEPFLRCYVLAGHKPPGGRQLLLFDGGYAVCRKVELITPLT